MAFSVHYKDGRPSERFETVHRWDTHSGHLTAYDENGTVIFERDGVASAGQTVGGDEANGE
ncbi:hypothetical protein [Rhodococcus sp. MEB064]|uniref:hypothetical protein n=1 Tax=Rhodococcus sp. MEB064 TaxID=1587522 RepID=UPI0005ACAEC8|nr:hypothetical protein [Rhodococcus sp. MEB064]KIQ15348.1 hypothetical protein RU01_15595 [Rhodococcus sp. MEB064]